LVAKVGADLAGDSIQKRIGCGAQLLLHLGDSSRRQRTGDDLAALVCSSGALKSRFVV
jgi:hypothetical protein